MNKPWVLHELDAAHRELGELIERIRADGEHDGFPDFYARLPFIYRHLNFAWRARDATDKQIGEALATKQSEKAEWRGFPHDLDPFIHDDVA